MTHMQKYLVESKNFNKKSHRQENLYKYDNYAVKDFTMFFR